MPQKNHTKPKIENKCKSIIIVCLMLMDVMISGAALAEDSVRTRTIETDAVTGWNRRFEQPLHIYDDIADFGFNTLRIRNPDGGRPLPIAEDTPRSALISTYFDVKTGMPVLPFMEAFSFNSDAPTVGNVPVVLSRDGTTRAPIKPHLEADQMEVSSVGSGTDITLDDWLKAKGKLTIQCADNGENWLHVKMTNLLPERHYSLWEWYVPTNVPGFPIVPTAVGGIGSDIMSDSNGNASYSVQTNQCLPLSIDEESPSRAIVAIVHWEHMSHGSVPIVPLFPVQPRLPGDNGAVHMWWPTSGGGHAF